MDGEDFPDKSKDMRKIAGLGTCHCCDYFYPRDNDVVLIEETQLIEKVKEIKNDYGHLKEINKIIHREIGQEVCLKVYGSLLVLCLLKSKCAEVNDMIKGQYMFVLIISDGATSDQRFAENLKLRLGGCLKIMKDVIVCFPDEFKRKFPHLPPTKPHNAFSR